MAVKKYSYRNQGNVYLSTHFQVKEFGAFGNGTLYTDDVLVDTTLIDYLEKIFTKVRASKAIISSGYRNTACDKAVGGSGVGQHVNGRAVDICYYDKNGVIIPSKIIVCVAFDLGMSGTAKIDNNYSHLDTRTSGTYRGDETRGTSNYWTNPYTYFGVSASDVEKYTGEVSKQYQSHGVGTKWYPNVKIGDGNYAGVFGVSMDALYIDSITYRVRVNGKWLPEVVGRADYAGIYGQAITGIAIEGVTYRVHTKGKGWLPWVNGYNVNDFNNGYAGNGEVIDGIEIK